MSGGRKTKFSLDDLARVQTKRLYNELKPDVYFKGPNDINFDQVETWLTDLKKYKDVKITELSPPQKAEFNDTVRVVRALNESEGEYGQMELLISNVFGDVKTAQPGTVASYFVGCLLGTRYNGNPSCTAICAGSVQPGTSVPGWVQCDTQAYLLEDNGDFIDLNSKADKRDSLVYVSDDAAFAGLTAAQLATLRDAGVDRIRVYRYSKDGLIYEPVSENSIEIEKAIYGDKANVSIAERGTTFSNGAIIAIVVIVIILLIIFFGWNIYRS